MSSVNNTSLSSTQNEQSTAFETINLLLPVFLLSFAASTINSVCNLSKRRRFILEMCIVACPTVFCVTILADVILQITIRALVCLCLILGFILPKNKEISKNAGKNTKEIKFITNVRAVTMFVTCVVILAVDFNIFPHRFTKNEKYGFSLMDLGVGLFIYSNGIVASELKRKVTSLFKVIKDSIPLLLLGFARFVALKEIDYEVSVLEYGVHWNFFLTLAATKILCSLILKFVDVKHSFFIAFIILIIHEFLLQYSLSDFVFNYKSRENFLTANREGIVSCLGYVGLYFLSVFIGIKLKKANDFTKTSFKNTIIFLFSCLFLLGFCTYHINLNYGISRRLANLGYCLWIAFVGIFITILYYVAENFQKYLYKNYGIKNGSFVIYLFEAINYNGLAYFLVANLLTGFVNILFDTMKMPAYLALTILIFYVFIKNFIVVVLYNEKIKLKI